jgi:hypothetical protein
MEMVDLSISGPAPTSSMESAKTSATIQQAAIIHHRCTRRLTLRDLPLNQG